jgi:hypothetical protein
MYSDRELKKDITEITNSSEVLKLRPVSFVMKNGKKLQFGFIAQEIENTQLENLVYKDGRGMRSVAYNQLVPLLLHQIQELTKRVAQLEEQARC